jgi:hypothetical protein
MVGYQPGICNIGKNEIRKRYGLAAVAFVITAIVVYAILSFNWPHWTLLISFIPLVMAFEGFYQGYFHFCAGFAAKGMYDLTGSGGSKEKVTDPGFHKEDMKKAMRIHIYSIISSLIIAAIIYFVL